MLDRPFPFLEWRASIAVVPTDDHAFTDALARQHDGLYRHCARLLGSRADAEDALQETLLRAWRGRRTQTSDWPRGWLYRSAPNVWFAPLARRDTTLVWLDDPDQHAAEASAPP